MAKITFITSQGEHLTLEGHTGSLMELAVEHGVPGIDGDCGGVCSCATCHVHISPEFMPLTGTRSEIEDDMLEFAENTSPYSRLACQLTISEDLDGLVLKVAR
ncbi:MAG: 2Fe-2S ferredoxin [Bacteroidetes bacterium]|nr:MAG: 2Fe-2S ferredoxin [Bacteroidota bacterium]